MYLNCLRAYILITEIYCYRKSLKQNVMTESKAIVGKQNLF